MAIGQAYSDVLTQREKKALETACSVIIDEAFENLKDLEDGESVSQTIFGLYLPPRYLPKYNYLFCKSFTVCLITALYKLTLPEGTRFASVAEELAAWVIIQKAEGILEPGANEDPFEDFVQTIFEDEHFQYLYQDAFDGIDETDAGAQMGMASLSFDDWFKPFNENDASRQVHPYVL
ncbi:hypothetical protein [Ktedonobacter racemifer]|uniref:Uncharacterized protein n=1 Tax=Ktedonobacter racemifer DSM 44963 TaxID=485913 RepID=D6TPM4_KTERA|nr:hypothetical protein [Ktedonobacter racemifer]EFH85638.1 hypothetical protein Krac_6865 [Ktedonobacter racemifer DSM 44963]